MGESETPVRSYSQLTQLEECGEQYRLKRIERLPEDPAVWFPAGNAFHHITEQFDRTALAAGLQQAARYDWAREFPAAFSNLRDELIAKGANPDVSTWRTAGVSKTMPKGQDVAWWDVNGPEMVDAYIGWRCKNADRYGIWVAADGTPGIEWDGAAELGGVTVVARVDLILVDLGTGATIIVDKKTGKTKPDTPLQLRVYRMVVERATAEPMWYGAYYMAREAELTTPVALDTMSEIAIEERFARAELSIQSGIFIPRPGKNCRQCAFKAQCLFAED